MQALIQGAVLGAMAYGTYEFTSMAVMKDWAWSIVITDTAWGAILTGGTAWAGVMLVQRFQWRRDGCGTVSGRMPPLVRPTPAPGQTPARLARGLGRTRADAGCTRN